MTVLHSGFDGLRFTVQADIPPEFRAALALGRKAWLFAGSSRGGDRAAFMYSLIVTAKMNDVDPQAWLADVLARLPDMPVSRLPELLPWKWKRSPIAKAA